MKRMRILTPILGALLLFGALQLALSIGLRAAPLSAAVPGWTAAAPAPRAGAFYGTVQCPGEQDSFYVIEVGSIVSPSTAAFRRYDAVSDTWTTLANYPLDIGLMGLACSDGFIYGAGGGLFQAADISNAFFIYDIDGDSWSSGPTLPRATLGAALGVWNGALFLIGGSDAKLEPVLQVDRYDIATGVWEANYGAPLPLATIGSSVQAGPYVYIVGGVTAEVSSNSSAALRYDLAHDVWGLGPDLKSRRALLGLAVTDQYLYAIGGDSDGGGTWWGATAMVERLDWTTWPLGNWQVVTSLPDAVLGNSAGACTEAMSGGEVWSTMGAMSFDTYTNTNLYLSAEPCYVGAYGLGVAPAAAAASGRAGTDVVYQLTVSNTGTAYDSYTMTVTSTWPVATSALDAIDPFAATSVVVTITVPLTATPGITDTAAIRIDSLGEMELSATAALTTKAAWEMWLPTIRTLNK